MKKLLLYIAISILLTCNLSVDSSRFYKETLKRVSKAEGRDVRPYLNASFHVAKMWKQFPSNNLQERVAIMIGYGGQESSFEPSYVHFNIPHKSYPGLHGLKVKHFSCDFSWAGLNNEQIPNLYIVAKAIQDGRSISRKELWRLGLHPDLMVKLKPILHIPKNLKLFKIDVSEAIGAKKQYDIQKKAHVKPSDMIIKISYSEDTQDKIDSVILYRLLNEFERSLRGWPWQSYKSEAYYICQKIIKE